ncbi:MAG: restriction endonuclease, partial [Verrucomicrobia bacterium]|nr:restriction endonuclease [Verrucomicrobiota bacterium]
KGVFVTTSYFTQPARSFAERHPFRIVLIDGEQLATLMIRHNVGVRIDEKAHAPVIASPHVRAVLFPSGLQK